MNIFRCFLRLWNWRCRRFRPKKYIIYSLALSEISSSMSAMLFAFIFPRAQRASTFDISAEQNVWPQSALRSFAIVCDYMETALFAIVCDPRSSAIIWKPGLMCQPETHWLSKQRVFCSCGWYIWITKAMFVNRYPFLWEHIKIHPVVMSMPNFTLFTVLSPKCSFGILARY